MQCITSAEEKHLAEQQEGEGESSVDAGEDAEDGDVGVGRLGQGIEKTTTISFSAA